MINFFKKMKGNRKGYTLTELIVVVAILGILAAIGTPMIMGQIDRAREASDNSDAKSMESAYKIAMAVANPPDKPEDEPDAEAIIDDILNPIPTPRRAGFEFYLDTSVGTVVCAEEFPTVSVAGQGTVIAIK